MDLDGGLGQVIWIVRLPFLFLGMAIIQIQSIITILYIQTTMQAQTHSQLSQSPEQHQVGITYFLSKGQPIPAVTKFMLTDFIVNEIAVDGQVVMLKERPNPGECGRDRDRDRERERRKEEESVRWDIGEGLMGEIVGVLGKEAAGAIAELYKRFDSGEKVAQWQFMIENMPDMSKQQRTKIHTFIRQKLHFIQSNTLDGHKMKLKLNKKLKKQNPASRKKYIHFILHKSNIDTMGAIFKLSKLTGINQKLFSTAGLKDKRGVTTQMVSVFNTDLACLKKFYNFANRNKEIWIAQFREGLDTDIGVGDLWGNQFGLVLRMIDPRDVGKIEARVESLKDQGMVNYFGLQRFGSCGTKTYMIGLKVLKGQWKQVVEELLLEETKDEVVNKLKQECYYNEQYAKAERSLPNKYKIEKNLFKGFKKHGKNYQNVFDSLPRSIKTLYLHSLQSYLWNRIVSRRLNEYGIKPHKGDVVGKKLTGFKLAKAEVEEERENKGEIEEKEEKEEKEEVEAEDVEILEEIDQEEKYEVELIADQAMAEKYSITDIVFPLYGPLINLPKQSLAYTYLLDQIKALGLTQQEFMQKAKRLCFKGMYRKMIIKPSNVSCQIIEHQNAKDEVQSPFYLNGDKVKLEPGPRRAVQVILQLPKSSYATMALRELLHISSSFESQMLLNKMYESYDYSQTQANKQQ